MKDSGIVGNYSMILDSKWRLSLPKKADAEVNYKDEIIVVLRDDYIELRTIESIRNEFEEIKENIKKASSLEIVSYWEDKFNKLCFDVQKKLCVDSNGRVTLGCDIAKKYSFLDGVMVVGFYDCFRVYSLSSYELEINKRK